MTSQQILQADLLDILFEKRNKLYGAYMLRRTYATELLKAMGITALLVLALLFLGGSAKEKNSVTKIRKEILLTDLALIKKVEAPKPIEQQHAASKPVKQDLFLDKLNLVERLQKPIVTQDELLHSTVGSSTVIGPVVSDGPPPPSPPSTGDKGATAPAVEKKDPPLPSRQPQFPGGTDAWLKFLSHYLTPLTDLDAGEKRSVLVRFSVDEEGLVTNFVVVQSGGADFDNEVIRVLKKMPRWLPALQNGKSVATSFTQPVTFQAAE